MERETRLREALVAQLERAGTLRFRAAAAAMRAVPRHRFVPGVPLEEAYADRAIALKMRDDDVISSISQPSMIAQMLELLDPHPGDHILEIGTGSGYNAALLCELAGPSGSVTSVELDMEMHERAARVLVELGYGRIDLRKADGAAATQTREQFDGVTITARCDDIAARWWDSLRDAGRMVIPMRLGTLGEFAVGFQRRGERLHGLGVHPCAFIPLRGEADVPVADDVFYRDATRIRGERPARRIRSIDAVRARDATPQLLNEADVVVARPVTMFGIRFEKV
jgi:protein-L-isoaspartate(D-aspartate) O-methyltransferase